MLLYRVQGHIKSREDYSSMAATGMLINNKELWENGYGNSYGILCDRCAKSDSK